MNYFAKTTFAAVILGVLSALIVNLPHQYNPYSLPMVVVILESGFLLDLAHSGGTPMLILMSLISFILPIILFLLWQPKLLTGAQEIPTRSKLFFALIAILSIAYCVYSIPMGLKYSGEIQTLKYLIYALLPMALIILAWFKLNKPTGYLYNLAFHFVGFLWLINLAFPWMGELP